MLRFVPSRLHGIMDHQEAGMNGTPRGGRMEFHVARAARDRYGFDEALFSSTGSVVFADFHAARSFAARMNGRRDLVRFPERAVSAGQVNALGLVDEMLHVLLERYRREVNPRVVADALARLDAELGSASVDATLNAFLDEFPPVAVYRREADSRAYLVGSTEGRPNREVALEELLMLWLGNLNPAFAPFQELFDDELLSRSTSYPGLTRALERVLGGAPGFDGPAGAAGDGSLLALLRAPALASPHSLTGQLRFLLERYGGLLGRYYYRLLSSLDLIAEEEKLVISGPAGPGGGGEARGPGLGNLDEEAENFTPDRAWMPRLVLIAKNAFVWLDQLSRKHGRSLERLDEIPDEELDALARAGIDGLWLIGLWERSRASREIKRRMGNADAVASAYSLFDYVIASDLGGEEACEVLRQKAAARGIRLASDMVPNHVGIDGRWVMEHPDWFVRAARSPFPAYSFESADLSTDPGVGIVLEDHYYDRSDAAVVFQRVDRRTGEASYVYHGNDGTSMPWNDTAQLDYLNPEVREAVVQTILHVARQFPVIRFDAAMTLARKHVQRLWYPEPGTGGAIASRADHAMTRAEFDRRMPVEFWREVVDRVAREAPDTLLLAEAFWMMEGYFVRTLGMHRVYNSAFMHMLRDERNSEYRLILRQTLEFEPEILKRFVNFMNNPDERTAVDQFGKGDKYFGVCTLMVTLPGLPMFGHGQVEGFAEKYGMEYRRAYLDERPDEQLVARHERQVFPLLHRRRVFAEVANFRLYDLVGSDGRACEDVFAFSNRAGEDRALVVVHNRFASASGWIRDSAPVAAREAAGARVQRRSTLGEGLALSGDPAAFAVFRDQVSGLEFLRSSRELRERGLYLELGAYEHHAFVDWREVRDGDWRPYEHLCGLLDGRGVPSVEDALRELMLGPVTRPFQDLVGAVAVRRFAAGDPTLPADFGAGVRTLAQGAANVAGATGDAEGLVVELAAEVAAALPRTAPMGEAEPEELLNAATTLGWIATHRLAELEGARGDAGPARSRSLVDEWRLGRVLAGTLAELGLPDHEAAREVALVKLLVAHQRVLAGRLAPSGRAYAVVQEWLGDPEVQAYLGVNRHRGVLWFGREPFERLLDAVVRLAALRPEAPAEAWARLARELREAAEASGYRVDGLVDLVTAWAAAGAVSGSAADPAPAD